MTPHTYLRRPACVESFAQRYSVWQIHSIDFFLLWFHAVDFTARYISGIVWYRIVSYDTWVGVHWTVARLYSECQTIERALTLRPHRRCTADPSLTIATNINSRVNRRRCVARGELHCAREITYSLHSVLSTMLSTEQKRLCATTLRYIALHWRPKKWRPSAIVWRCLAVLVEVRLVTDGRKDKWPQQIWRFHCIVW